MMIAGFDDQEDVQPIGIKQRSLGGPVVRSERAARHDRRVAHVAHRIFGPGIAAQLKRTDPGLSDANGPAAASAATAPRATPALGGSLLDAGRGMGHILDARGGGLSWSRPIVPISANRAAVANGLSTAFSVPLHDAIDRVPSLYATASLEGLVSPENNGKDDR